LYSKLEEPDPPRKQYQLALGERHHRSELVSAADVADPSSDLLPPLLRAAASD
jgi:hypothetical protein